MDLFNEATRLLIGLAYLWVAVLAFRTRPRLTARRLVTLGVSAVATIWGMWYLALALLDLSPDPWGILNRALHILIVGLFAFQVTTIRSADSRGL